MIELGRVVITRGAVEALRWADVAQGLGRHRLGDWGSLGKEDKEANEVAAHEGHRIVSVYSSANRKFYVITEWDRSVTTILLPEEY